MRTVIVTGSSRGIGAEIARTFAKNGDNVVINCKSSKDKVQILFDEIESYGAKALLVCGDVSETEDVKRLFDETVKAFGTVDILINNAGIARSGLFQDTSDDDWEQIINTNLGGAFKCSREAVRYMLKNHSGRIINISSIWGQVGGSCEVSYSASKAGVIGLTKALAKELAPSGITVNCIAPGVINTDMLSCYTKDDLCALCDETPVGRLGTPQDIASTALFLASKSAEFITGQIIGVNGGFGE